MHVIVGNSARIIPGPRTKKAVARILLADSDLASRLTIRSLLATAGYEVDSAASASEAIGKLDSGEYQLVLADLKGEAGEMLLSFARQKEFRPATALISSDVSELNREDFGPETSDHLVRMSQDNVSYLLARVADLIGNRADRRLRRSLLRAS